MSYNFSSLIRLRKKKISRFSQKHHNVKEVRFTPTHLVIFKKAFPSWNIKLLITGILPTLAKAVPSTLWEQGLTCRRQSLWFEDQPHQTSSFNSANNHRFPVAGPSLCWVLARAWWADTDLGWQAPNKLLQELPAWWAHQVPWRWQTQRGPWFPSCSALCILHLMVAEFCTKETRAKLVIGATVSIIFN